MATTKWGPEGNNDLATAQPDLHVWRGVHGVRSYGTISLLPVQLWQQLATAFLYADLYTIEHRRSNRSGPPRQLPDADGGRSRDSTASGDERRGGRQDAGAGRQPLAMLLSLRGCLLNHAPIPARRAG